MELISRRKVLEYIADYQLNNRGVAMDWTEAIDSIFNEVEKLPTIESRAKGKWIAYAENNTPIMLRCSMCTHSVVWGSIANYCPNCGAEMENE